MPNILLKLRKNLTAAADRSISLALATASILGQAPRGLVGILFWKELKTGCHMTNQPIKFLD